MRRFTSLLLIACVLLLSGSLPVQAAAKRLTPVEQIAAQLAAHKEKFTLTLPDVTQAHTLFKQAMQVDDYIYMIIDTYTYKTTRSAGQKKGKATYEVKYRESKAQSDYVTKKAKEIVSALTTKNMSDFQKEKLLHDYVAKHVKYDDSLTQYTAYEALTTGYAVCQGYALLTYRLMQVAGIPVHIVLGEGNGEAHVWNKVKLGGKWYNVDTTWDAQESGVDYRYFNVTDKELARDHTWKKSDWPAATTDYRAALKALIKKKDKNAVYYESILKEIGEKVTTLKEAINVINNTIAKKQKSVKFVYVYGSRNIKDDVNAMIKGQKGAEYVYISYNYSNGVATVEATLTYK